MGFVGKQGFVVTVENTNILCHSCLEDYDSGFESVSFQIRNEKPS